MNLHPQDHNAPKPPPFRDTLIALILIAFICFVIMEVT